MKLDLFPLTIILPIFYVDCSKYKIIIKSRFDVRKFCRSIITEHHLTFLNHFFKWTAGRVDTVKAYECVALNYGVKEQISIPQIIMKEDVMKLDNLESLDPFKCVLGFKRDHFRIKIINLILI